MQSTAGTHGQVATRNANLSAQARSERIEVEGGLSSGWQKIVLGLVLAHLVAVFSEPFHFFSRSDVQVAPDAAVLRNLLRPYSQTLFLDHGYFFFAPNPGPGHLLRVAISDDPLPQVPDDRRATPLAEIRALDGSEVSEHMFPDRYAHFPRLLYHRYFMLSEFYFNRYAPRQVAPELEDDAPFIARWKRDQQIYTQIRQGIESFARHKYQKDFVRIDRIERALPDRNSILRENIRLTDSRWLSVLPETMDFPAQRQIGESRRSEELPATSRPLP